MVVNVVVTASITVVPVTTIVVFVVVVPVTTIVVFVVVDV